MPCQKTVVSIFTALNKRTGILASMQVMIGAWRSGGGAPLILNIGNRWGVWLASRLGRLTVEERRPGTNWTGGWVGPSSGQDELQSVELFFRCPARNLVAISTELSRISNTAARTWNHTGKSFEANGKITAFTHVLPKFPSVPYNMSLGISLLLKHMNVLFWVSIFPPLWSWAQRGRWPHSSGF
jgi:hypothetical protein